MRIGCRGIKISKLLNRPASVQRCALCTTRQKRLCYVCILAAHRGFFRRIVTILIIAPYKYSYLLTFWCSHGCWCSAGHAAWSTGFVSSVRLRRSPASAASTSTRLWIYGDSDCVDDVVCHPQNSASAIQGLPFSCSVCPVWGATTTRIWLWPHRNGRYRPNRCSARAQVPSVCRRLPNLRRHVSKCSSVEAW